MEKDQNSETEYVRRFNDGYIVAKYLPELSEKLSKNDGKSPGISAMRDGRNQYVYEQQREKLPSWLLKNGRSNQDRSFGKGKDKTNEPER